MQRFKYQVLPAAISAVLAGVTWGTPAFAEEEPNAAKGDQPLQTVVVTAQKREQDVQSVPVAISVVSGDDIIDRGIDNSNDIQRLVPGLSGQQSGFSRPRWFIRGIGSNDPNLTTESPLGVYRDEIFTALTSLQSFAIYDLERVEVLKGPQGTLWGKNTTAGAVNFISRKPSQQTDGYLRLSAGDWGARSAQGAAGGGISDRLAGRVSFYHQEYDGYATNLYNGKDGPGFEQTGLRVQLLGDLSDNLSALYKVEFGNRKPGGGYAHTVNSEAGGADRYGFTPGYGSKPKADSDYYAGESVDDTDTIGHLFKLDWELGHGYTFTSITGYDESENYTTSTSGHPPTYIGTRDKTASRGTTDGWQLSQEFRLVSPQTDRLSWIAGLHYFRYRFDRDTANATFEPAARTSFNRTWLKQDAESYAAFGSLKFNVTDRFALNGGLRWTEETKDINIHTVRTGTGSTVHTDHAAWWNLDSLGSPLTYNQNISRSGKWSELTGDFTPEYFFTDNFLGYFRYARGYRSGGFGSTIPTLNAGQVAAGVQPYIPQVEPEYLDSYEFGVKSSWLDGRLQANAAIYYYDHKDIQLNVQAPNPLNLVNPPTGAFSQNAAGGEVKGLELEVQWRPLDNLRIGGAFNITDAKYKDFNPVLSVSGVTGEVDRSGNRYFRTPKYMASLDLEYRAPLPNRLGTLVLATDWVYRSHQYYDAARQGASQGEVAVALDGNVYQSEWQEQDAYWVGNAKVAYEPPHGQTEYFVSVSNLLDETYVVNSTAASPSYPVALGQPRFVNLGFTARF